MPPLEILLIKEETERAASLKEAINSLPENERNIITRMFYKNESLEEIARSLGQEVSIINDRVEDVLEKLKEFIGL